MAPTKGKAGASKGSTKGSTKSRTKSSSKAPTSASSSKSKSKSLVQKATQQKTKPLLKQKKKRRVYSEKELDIPKLNMITPAGVQKPKGKKKGKVFVDDQESMMTILAMVNADKEGQIESKMLKARQMEEIRLARQREMEARVEEKKARLEETKNSLRRKKGKHASVADTNEPVPDRTSSKPKKRVSFG